MYSRGQAVPLYCSSCRKGLGSVTTSCSRLGLLVCGTPWFERLWLNFGRGIVFGRGQADFWHKETAGIICSPNEWLAEGERTSGGLRAWSRFDQFCIIKVGRRCCGGRRVLEGRNTTLSLRRSSLLTRKM